MHTSRSEAIAASLLAVYGCYESLKRLNHVLMKNVALAS